MRIKEKTKVALYPVFAYTMPVVRYLMKYRSDIEIVELLSPPGSCGCGKDAGFFDNREELGKLIIPFSDTDTELWENLWLLHYESLGFTEERKRQSVYAPMINIATRNHKRILNNLSDKHGITSVKPATSISTIVHNTKAIKRFGTLNPIKQFTVFVGGIVGLDDSFEVFLNLYGELSKHARVTAFSTSKNAEICGVTDLNSVVNSNLYSENNKVFEIEKIITGTSDETKADIILIHLEEALLPFSDTQTSGFGIIPYLFSKIVSPDYFVCCLPYGYSNPLFLKECATGLKGCLGFSPDRWHLSNAMLDYTIVSNVIDAGLIHIPMDLIEHSIRNVRSHGINIGSDVSEMYLHETVSGILQAYKDNQLIDSII